MLTAEPITEATVIIPATDVDLALTATPTSTGFVAVELGMGADPVAFTPAVVEMERLRMGSVHREDGTWHDSWRFRKEYLRDPRAAAGMPVFDARWLEAQQPGLCDPVLRMDIDTTPAGINVRQAGLGLPEGFAFDSRPFPIAISRRESDQQIVLSAAFWRLDEPERTQQLHGWLVPKERGRVKVWLLPDSQPTSYPLDVSGVQRAFGAGIDVGEGVEQSDTAMSVFACDTMEQAAEFASNTIRPAEMGRLAAAVGRYYHNALVCPVRKMHGITVIRSMIDDMGYGYIWHDRIADRVAETRSKALGWAGGEASSPYLFGKWVDAIQYQRVQLRSLTTWQQHTQYIYDDMGRIVQQFLASLPVEVRERHGDSVIACALALRACLDMPLYQRIDQPDRAPYGSLAWRDEQDAIKERKREADRW